MAHSGTHHHSGQVDKHDERVHAPLLQVQTGRHTARTTRQREAVSRALREVNAPVSAKQILVLASKYVQGLGLATVYRTLKLLIEVGEAKSVDIPGMSPLFEVAGKGHHHHFVCTRCETVFELTGACCGHFEDLAPAGFQTVAHELSLYGTCQKCTTDGAVSKVKSGRARKAGEAGTKGRGLVTPAAGKGEGRPRTTTR